MRRYHNAAINSETGLPIPNPTITVYHAGTTTTATIYSDEGVTSKANPFSGDSQGRFDFYVADGDYDVKIEGTGLTAYTVPDITVSDAKRGGFVLTNDALYAILANAFYRRTGTPGFDRVDTGKAAWNVHTDAVNDWLKVQRAAAAANPITWTDLLKIGSLGQILITAGTFTSDIKALELSAIWNAGAITFTGIKVNITDTASAAASLLAALQVGGVDKFRVFKDGVIRAAGALQMPDGSLSTPIYTFDADQNTGMLSGGADILAFAIGGNEGLRLSEPADGNVALLVRRNVGGTLTLQQVSMGAADSGGSGFKYLRVPN